MNPARLAIALLLGASLMLAGCINPKPWGNHKSAVSVSAGPIRVEEGYDKVTSLMTALDYDIGRATTINGLAIFNYYRECRADFTEEICQSMAKKHQTTDQQIYRPDGGYALNFYRRVADNLGIEVNAQIKNENGTVKILLNFDERNEGQEASATFYPKDSPLNPFNHCGKTPPEGYSRAATDDLSKVIASLARSYGLENLCVHAPL